MLSCEEALQKLFKLVTPLDSETISIDRAFGRILREDCVAKFSQPTFSLSAMDGYAINSSDLKTNAKLEIIDESAAGHPSQKKLKAGQTIRIFTGGVVPDGADKIIIQEQVTKNQNFIKFRTNIDTSTYIRPAGSDFKRGFKLTGNRRITPYDLMLIAGMGYSELKVSKKPIISIISTGDELVLPGTKIEHGQIICSNSYGIKAILEESGAAVRILPIAKDNITSLETTFKLAQNSDLIVTTGGASVGDHDLVQEVTTKMGIQPAFYKVAMRPGKPLMAGKSDAITFVGLPGNPVSSMVCSHVFLKPMINRMLGLKSEKLNRNQYPLTHTLDKNGSREHYMRAKLKDRKVTVQKNQDSASTSILQSSNALVVRPPLDENRKIGDLVDVIEL